MKLQVEQKTQLISNGQKVYSAYLFLDMLNNAYYPMRHSSFLINGGKQTFKNYLSSLFENADQDDPDLITEDFKLGNTKCQLKLQKQEDDTWSINLNTEQKIKKSDFKNKEPKDCSQEDFFNILANISALRLKKANDDKLKFCVDLNIDNEILEFFEDESLTLGDKDKIELYQWHIINLQRMLHEVEQHDIFPHMLVDMATGTGKSYTQALWFLVLVVSKIPAIFCVVDEALARQLKKDFMRLLPATVTAKICTVEEWQNAFSTGKEIEEEGQKDDENIDSTSSKISKPESEWFICTQKNLFLDFWDEIKGDEDSPGYSLCIDEYHQATDIELYKKRYQQLAKKVPLIFLGATPTKDAYELSGNKSIASLSRCEKEKYRFAKPVNIEARSARGTVTESKEHMQAKSIEQLIFNFADSIEEERSSVAHTYVHLSQNSVRYRQTQDLYYRSTDEDIDNFMRWNIHCSITEKALILTDEHDPLINLDILSNNTNYLAEENNVRNAVGSFFSEYKAYLQYHVVHEIIENVLMYVLKLSEAQIAEKRIQEDDIFNALLEEFDKKLIKVLKQKTTKEVRSWLRRKGLSKNAIDELAPILCEVLRMIDDKIADNNNYLCVFVGNNPENQLLQSFVKELLKIKKLKEFTEKHEEIKNLSKDYPYKASNLVPRNNIYDFFKMEEDLDAKFLKKYKEMCAQQRRAAFIDYLADNYPERKRAEIENKVDETVDFSGIEDYLAYRVGHGLIDNALMYLTQLNMLELDQQRFNHFPHLIEKTRLALQKKFNKKSIKKWLKQDGLASEIADEAAVAIYAMLEIMKKNEDRLNLFVDNWGMSKYLHYHIKNKGIVSDYCDQHKKIYLIDGLKNSPSTINDSQPFFGFKHKQYEMNDKKVRENPALHHSLSAMEIFNPIIKQHVFNPDYCPELYTEENIDILFKRGLIGQYVTNKKAVGFNDANLHHVAMLIDSNTSKLNEPKTTVQSLGRLRALNPLREPTFFMINDKSVKVSLDHTALENKKNKKFISIYFDTKNKHYQVVKVELVKELVAEIKKQAELHISANQNSAEFDKKINDLIFEYFEKIYNYNDHDYDKSRKEFGEMLTAVHQEMQLVRSKIKKTYKFSTFSRLISSILNVVGSIYYRLFLSPSYIKFTATTKDLKDEQLNEKTYAHIICNYHYKEFSCRKIIVQEIFNEIGKIYEACSEDQNILNSKTLIDMKRYIQHSLWKKNINSILSPLKDEHLQALLMVIYPDDQEVDVQSEQNEQDGQQGQNLKDEGYTTNQEKLRILRDFNKDLHELNAKDFLEKYCLLSDRSPQLLNIITWLNGLVEEIHCDLSYYHYIRSGKYMEVNIPKLKTNEHPIWHIHGSPSFSLARQIKPLVPIRNAMQQLNLIEEIKNEGLVELLDETTNNFIFPLTKALKKKSNQPILIKDASCTNRREKLRHEALLLANTLNKGHSFDDDEIASNETKDLNAVCKLYREYNLAKQGTN